jgi:hypothetical protein
MKTIGEFTAFIEETVFPESLTELKHCEDIIAVERWQRELCQTICGQQLIGEHLLYLLDPQNDNECLKP